MDNKDTQVIKEQVQIVLRGPDGKIKDERNIKTEETDEKHDAEE